MSLLDPPMSIETPPLELEETGQSTSASALPDTSMPMPPLASDWTQGVPAATFVATARAVMRGALARNTPVKGRVCCVVATTSIALVSPAKLPVCGGEETRSTVKVWLDVRVTSSRAG